MFSHFRLSVFSLFFCSAFFFAACQIGCSQQPLIPPRTAGGDAAAPQNITGELLPLVPGFRERNVTNLYVLQLEERHISQRKLDENVSKEALRLYIKSLDLSKMYFNHADIAEFKAKYETQICELAKQRNVTPAFEIYNRFLDRVKERVDMILKILDTPQDFTLNEEIERDKSKDFTLDDNVVREKKLRDFAKTPEESYERWRKRIKNDLLVLKSEAKDKEEERQKAIAEGKEPPKEEERDPVERLKKRYISFQKRMLFENHIEGEKVLEDIKRAANDEVMELYLSAISGALDPHTSYMSASSLANFESMMSKSLEGIGAVLTSEDGYTIIKKLSKGGPADKSGLLKENDKITGVGQGKDGKIEDVVDVKLTDVVKLIRGSKGSVVKLEVLPADGTASQTIEIVRDKITLDDQAAKKGIFEINKKPDGTPYKIGVIRLPDFYLDMDAFRRGDPNARSTTGDVKEILKEFNANNVDAVVLDLSMNGGGSLQEAIALTGLFIETGNVVQTKDETSVRPQQRDDFDPGCDWTGPLVVITSKFSASASEIFAGAIKDYKRGLIVGDSQTHGKGTVQQMQDLSELLFNRSDSSYGAIKITIQGFYRPSGVSPQREGVLADVRLPSVTDAMEDICEADLDNPLTLNKVPQAKNFAVKNVYVTPQISADLQKRSEERIKTVEDFAKEIRRIENYKEIRAKRSSTLNEQTYFEELKRLDADKTEKDKFESMFDAGEIERDFYLDEVMAVSVDYLQLLQQSGIVFPKERTVIAKPSLFNSLFGR